MLDQEWICSGPAHVVQGGTKVFHRPFVILLLKSPDGSLQPESTKIVKLAGGVAAHGGSIARASPSGNFGQRI
jgi:hypothetical protein